MRFEWLSLGVGAGILGGGVSGGVGGWVSKFWTNGIVCMLILIISIMTMCLPQFSQKVD